MAWMRPADTLALSPRAGYRIHTSQFEIFLVGRARSVLGVHSPSKDGRPFGRPLAAPEGAKRSGAAAKRLDGDGPMRPPVGDV